MEVIVPWRMVPREQDSVFSSLDETCKVEENFSWAYTILQLNGDRFVGAFHEKPAERIKTLVR